MKPFIGLLLITPLFAFITILLYSINGLWVFGYLFVLIGAILMAVIGLIMFIEWLKDE